MSFIQTIQSPNKNLSLEVDDEGGQLRYRLLDGKSQVIRWSRLGLVMKSTRELGRGVKLLDHSTSSVDETDELPWGQNRTLHTNYVELVATLQEVSPPMRIFAIRFRLFDDGLAFRYEIPAQDDLEEIEVAHDRTEFNVPRDSRAWWIPSYQPDRYEYLYQKSFISDLPVVHTPLAIQYSNGRHVAIHEAALYDFGSMNIKPTKQGGLRAEVTPLSEGIVAHMAVPALMPWRTITIASSAAGLVDSTMMLSLNLPPDKSKDFSWVKPLKFMGIWWGMFVGTFTWGRGKRHGATTENAIKYIDYCKKYGIGGLLIEGWNIGWDGEWTNNGDKMQFTQPTEDFDIEKVAAYAKQNGVELIGHHETSSSVKNYESQMDEAFAYYEKLGIRYVKTGYVGTRMDKKEFHHSQYGVRHYQRSVEAAARHGIMLDIHEPIKGTGIERSWPNLLTREGARGQEYEGGGLDPKHLTILPYTRLLAGPMDYTPGIFDLTNYTKRVASTLARQLAMFVVVYSPMQMVADQPENYENQPAFKFIQDVPVDWDKSITLDGAIGQFVISARKDRSSDDWYVGGLTNERARQVSIELDFLDKNKKYKAEVYRDGAEAHWRTNQKDIIMESIAVERSDKLDIRIAPGGGFAIRFTTVILSE